MDRRLCPPTSSPPHADIRRELGDNRGSLSRRARHRASPLRPPARHRACVSGGERVRGKIDRARGAGGRATPPGLSADASRGLLACRAHHRSVALGRSIPDWLGVPGALGRAARDGVAAAAARGSVRLGLDRDRFSSRVQPAVFDRRPARRADVVFAIGRFGARSRRAARATPGPATSRRLGAHRPCWRYSLGVANACMA